MRPPHPSQSAHPLRLVTCAAGSAWENDLVLTAADGSFGVEIVARCLEVGELLAAVRTGHPHCVVFDPALGFLDTIVLARVHEAGAVAIAVADDRGRVPGALPIDAVVHPALGAAAIVDAALDLCRPLPVPALSEAASEPVAPIIAIWSGNGSPGRTTLAVNLAWELALGYTQTLLVDLDTYGATVGIQLDIPEAPNVLGLSRQALRGELTARHLEDAARRPLSHLGVVPGPPRPDLWPELRAEAVVRLLEIGSGIADAVVCDSAECIEDDEELVLSGSPWRRNQATLAVLEIADLILVPVACDPVSVRATVLALGELRGAAAGAVSDRACAVVTRVGSPADAAEVKAVLAEHCGIRTMACLPDDPTAMRTARWRGMALATAAPRSPLRRAFARLAESVAADLRTLGRVNRCHANTRPSVTSKPAQIRALPDAILTKTAS